MKVLLLSVLTMFISVHAFAGKNRKIAEDPQPIQGLVYDDSGITIQISNACITKEDLQPLVEENSPAPITFSWPSDKSCAVTSKNGVQIHFNYSEFGQGKGGRYKVANPLKPGVFYDLAK
jgi:hypothetical protein